MLLFLVLFALVIHVESSCTRSTVSGTGSHKIELTSSSDRVFIPLSSVANAQQLQSGYDFKVSVTYPDNDSIYRYLDYCGVNIVMSPVAMPDSAVCDLPSAPRFKYSSNGNSLDTMNIEYNVCDTTSSSSAFPRYVAADANYNNLYLVLGGTNHAAYTTFQISISAPVKRCNIFPFGGTMPTGFSLMASPDRGLLISPSGYYRLQILGGMVRIVNMWGGDDFWSFGTAGNLLTDTYVLFVDAGGFGICWGYPSMYTSCDIVVWYHQPPTPPGEGGYLSMQDDGNLVLYTASGQWVWQSYTSSNWDGNGGLVYPNRIWYPGATPITGDSEGIDTHRVATWEWIDEANLISEIKIVEPGNPRAIIGTEQLTGVHYLYVGGNRNLQYITNGTCSSEAECPYDNTYGANYCINKQCNYVQTGNPGWCPGGDCALDIRLKTWTAKDKIVAKWCLSVLDTVSGVVVCLTND